jgi:PAS domain S-box-containing protein
MASETELRQEVEDLRRELAQARAAPAAASGETQRLLRAVFDGAVDGMVIVDDELRLVDANPAACDLLGLPREKVLGRVAGEFMARDLGFDFQAVWRDFLAQGLDRRDYVAVRPDGERRTVEVTAAANIAPGRHLAIFRDITERRKAEEALRRSEDIFAKSFRASPIGIAITTLQDGRCLEVNDRLLEYFGLTREETLGHSFMDLGVWVDPSHREGVVRDLRARGSLRELEFLGRTKTGEIRNLVASVERLEIQGQECMLSLLQDITDRKRSEEARRQAEERLRTVVNNAPIVMFALDREGRFTLSEGKGLERSGYRSGQALGESVFDKYAAASLVDDMGKVLPAPEVLRRVLAGETVSGTSTLPAGSFRLNLLPIRDAAGEITGILGVAVDITEQQQAERALRETTELFWALVRASPAAVTVLDLEGRVKLWNPAAERMFGWTAEEVQGQMPPTAPPEEIRELLEMARQGKSLTAQRVRRRREDGSLVEVSLSIAPLRDRDREIVGMVSILVDITEQLGLEAQLRQAQRMEALGRLAGGIAHDFNNMLAAIHGFASVARDDLSPGDPLRRELEQVLAAADRARILTSQLLAFSRRQVMPPAVLDLNALIARLEKMLHRLVGEDIEVVTRLSPELGRVLASAAQVEQMLLNLVVNARDAMPRGGVLTLETADVDLDEAAARRHLGVRPGKYVLLSVSDTGAGIDPEAQAHIFEPFYTTKEEGEGTGLGLSIVYGIVTQAGGHLWVESERGQGAAFRMLLPRTEEAATEPVDRPLPTPVSLRGTETVLVVEDEALVRRLASEILKRHGYTVLEASNGGEALLICEKHPGPIHLLLTDVVMPRMSGPELAQRLTALRPALKVAFMSGYVRHSTAHHATLPPNAVMVDKPFANETLLSAVRRALSAP